MLKAKAIIIHSAKYSSFNFAEAALRNSSARLVFSDVAQQQHNASHAAFSYVNAAETNIRASRRGIPIRELPHKDNKLKKQKT